MKVRGFCLGAVLLMTACADVPDPPPPPPLPIDLQVGVHEVVTEVPAGWEHLDHGLEHRFRQGLAQISLADHGPVTREGLLREVRHALELFRKSRVDDARAHLDGLDLRLAFSDGRQWGEFNRLCGAALDSGRATDDFLFDSERAWAEVLQYVEGLARRDLATIVETALPVIDSSVHREVADTRQVEVDGCEGLRVETWDRLSHDHRRSFLFLLNRGNLLVLHMRMGRHAEVAPTFEGLAASLRIRPSQITS